MLYVVARYNIQQFKSIPGHVMRPALLSRTRRAAASPFPARLAMSGPRSTIATSDDAPRAPSSVPTMAAAGARARIAASDDVIHSLTLEGPSGGGFSRPPSWRSTFRAEWAAIPISMRVPVSSAPCQPFRPIIGMLCRRALRNLRSSSVDNGGLRTWR